MSYFTNKQIFYVNSRNRINSNDSDTSFSYQLNIDSDAEFDRVVILSASIPKSYYLIQSGQNTFKLKEGSSEVTIYMTPGNYTRQSLSRTVKSLLNTNSPNNYVYDVAFNNINTTPDDGKYYFTVSNNSGVQPSFIFESYIAEQLGFQKYNTYNFSSNSLVSIGVCNLIRETTLYLRSNICQNKEGDNVLQEIYANGETSYSYINFYNPNPIEYSKTMIEHKSNIYYFLLTDEDGQNINTNGININFTIMVYKKNNIYDLIKGAIKYFTLET